MNDPYVFQAIIYAVSTGGLVSFLAKNASSLPERRGAVTALLGFLLLVVVLMVVATVGLIAIPQDDAVIWPAWMLAAGVIMPLAPLVPDKYLRFHFALLVMVCAVAVAVCPGTQRWSFYPVVALALLFAYRHNFVFRKALSDRRRSSSLAKG